MAAINVVLCRRDANPAHDVSLTGTDDGTNFSLDKLQLPGPVTCDLPAPLVGPSACLLAVTGGAAGDFRLKTPEEISATTPVPIPAVLTLTPAVTLTAATKVFGHAFQVDGDLKATVTLT